MRHTYNGRIRELGWRAMEITSFFFFQCNVRWYMVLYSRFMWYILHAVLLSYSGNEKSGGRRFDKKHQRPSISSQAFDDRGIDSKEQRWYLLYCYSFPLLNAHMMDITVFSGWCNWSQRIHSCRRLQTNSLSFLLSTQRVAYHIKLSWFMLVGLGLFVWLIQCLALLHY